METRNHVRIFVFNLAESFFCGFGGCSAPEKPIRVRCPARYRSESEESHELANDRTVGLSWVNLEPGFLG